MPGEITPAFIDYMSAHRSGGINNFARTNLINRYIPGAVIKTQMSSVTTIQGDKTIVESAVIGFPRERGRRSNASARSRKSWCLHKILISDTSQSGIRYKGSCVEGSPTIFRARHFIYLYFILFALAFPTKGRADSIRALLSRYSLRQIVIMRIDT